MRGQTSQAIENSDGSDYSPSDTASESSESDSETETVDFDREPRRSTSATSKADPLPPWEELKSLCWGRLRDPTTQTVLDRRRIVELYGLLKDDPEVPAEYRKSYATNARNLTETIISHYPFNVEDTSCPCDVPDCRRLPWNCQLVVTKRGHKLVPNRARCVFGSKTVRHQKWISQELPTYLAVTSQAKRAPSDQYETIMSQLPVFRAKQRQSARHRSLLAQATGARSDVGARTIMAQSPLWRSTQRRVAKHKSLLALASNARSTKQYEKIMGQSVQWRSDQQQLKRHRSIVASARKAASPKEALRILSQSNSWKAVKTRKLRCSTDSSFFNVNGVVKNMVRNSKSRGHTLTKEQACLYWLPLIAKQKRCEECHHAVIELSNSGLFQASPQRPDVSQGYSAANLKVFCLGLYNDWDLANQTIIRDAIRNAEVVAPLRPLPDKSIKPPPAINNRLAAIRQNMIATQRAECRKRGVRGAPTVVSQDEMYKMWYQAEDTCRLSGVKGSWESKQPLSLSFDRIVPGSRGGLYTRDNLQVALHAVNFAKCAYSQDDTIMWLENFKHPRRSMSTKPLRTRKAPERYRPY
ncbi:hypothetical protein SmJEL517_g06194 [Synchytrium microbalum]|uniref:Uncharacterized protein n=1 Tax=Synchytrium microbalum TaxID=1806994 RepID=A0A507BXW7_9FUNG|nr:uncharacterized protein SmJEL517_g06194 [Synchytrium microbalum]TPX30185.1 hypothetical protein SmJEL517_g06194 [Synchytrium microbalum]